MARIVRHDKNRPYVIEVGDQKVAICACGLSKKKPYCDGTHRITWDEPEGTLSAYDEQNIRRLVRLVDENGALVDIPSSYPLE
ncbi:MAG: CDGSH iron-sulfur domain-containing protein [Armatimonadetes bacterium]|nr:CDGSH iron-sulfur domain-containing protein [Armatimonadota bacterium]MDW8121058.1 CDGSH iron-sulfur domain-containing protein [Armatimonadota bacterium]